MFKKIVLFAAVLAMIASLSGCSCGATATPTPTPSLKPVATTAPMVETTPEVVISPEASKSPEAMATPGASAGKIENFKEGTEVKAADVPEVKKAIEKKYEKAQIKTIKHAMQNGEQVYAVEITTGTTTETVYVSANGTIMDKKA
ncbi:MAG: hypothetical protein RR297_08515 [Clostridia bacterium]